MLHRIGGAVAELTSDMTDLKARHVASLSLLAGDMPTKVKDGVR